MSKVKTLSAAQAISIASGFYDDSLQAKVLGAIADGRKTVEYIAWTNMRYRCNNKNHPDYHNYGGRGIGVCKSWNVSFLSFIRDMGLRPSPNHSLERKDNNKGYCPSNCKWATKSEQCNNQRINTKITFNGESLTLSQWSVRRGFKRNLIGARLKSGWSVKNAITLSPSRDNLWKSRRQEL